MLRKTPLKRTGGLMAGVPSGTRRLVYERDGWDCAMCGSNKGLQLHHAVPRSVGGSDFPDNLITLCWRCHAMAHGTRFPDLPEYIDRDWMEEHIMDYLVTAYGKEDWYPYK